MNKKRLILFVVTVIVLLSVLGTVFYMSSLRTVRINIVDSDVKVTVFRGDTKRTEIATLSESGELRLQKDTYTIIASGDKYTDTSRGIAVQDKDISVNIEPEYSSIYRSEILLKELPEINQAIANAYPAIISNFTINKGTIEKKGQWYITTLTQAPPTASEEGDFYRTILKKENNTWVIKAEPALVINAAEHKDIPADIIRKLNLKDSE